MLRYLNELVLATLLVGVALIAGCGSGDSASSAATPEGTAPPISQASASYAQWAGALRDPRHTSTATGKGPTSGEIRWKRKLEGPVVPGPAIAKDGTIYEASNGGVLHAFDPDGAELWSFDGGSPYGSDLSTTPAITGDGTILWPGPGALFALNPNGELLWTQRFNSQPLSPLLGDDSGSLVYVMDSGGELNALQVAPRGPSLLWSTEIGSVSYSSPALGDDGTVYVGADQSLFAVGADGHVAWSFETDDLVEVSPAVTPDGTVVIGSNDAMVYGVHPDGSQKWAHDLGEITYSSPAAAPGGVVYIGDHSGAVSALDASDGETINRYAGQGRSEDQLSVGVWTAPLIDRDGNIYFGTRLGHVYGFDASGEQLFDVQTGGTVDSYPALSADGTLLIGSEDGYLYAIGHRRRNTPMPPPKPSSRR